MNVKLKCVKCDREYSFEVDSDEWFRFVNDELELETLKLEAEIKLLMYFKLCAKCYSESID